MCAIPNSEVDFRTRRDRLTDWSLTALSPLIGYIVPLKIILQLKSEINARKLTILRVGNTYNKPLQ